jgi:hypothetical protein
LNCQPPEEGKNAFGSSSSTRSTTKIEEDDVAGDKNDNVWSIWLLLAGCFIYRDKGGGRAHDNNTDKDI